MRLTLTALQSGTTESVPCEFARFFRLHRLRDLTGSGRRTSTRRQLPPAVFRQNLRMMTGVLRHVSRVETRRCQPVANVCPWRMCGTGYACVPATGDSLIHVHRDRAAGGVSKRSARCLMPHGPRLTAQMMVSTSAGWNANAEKRIPRWRVGSGCHRCECVAQATPVCLRRKVRPFMCSGTGQSERYPTAVPDA